MVKELNWKYQLKLSKDIGLHFRLNMGIISRIYMYIDAGGGGGG